MNLGSIRSPGLVVVVRHRGEVVYQECRGTVDLESEAPVTLETAFDLASVSKQFTAALVMQLVEAGLLELSTPLSRFQPFDDEKWSGVTVESLLSHTSGLPDYLHGNVDLTKEVCN